MSESFQQLCTDRFPLCLHFHSELSRYPSCRVFPVTKVDCDNVMNSCFRNVKRICNVFLFHSSICNNHFVYLLLVHSVSCRDRPPGPFAITDCCFFRVFSKKSRPLLNFTFSKTSITVYSFHSLVDDNCRTSFCSKKLDNRLLFHKVVISRRRHFLTDRDRCTHIATSLIANGNDVTKI